MCDSIFKGSIDNVADTLHVNLINQSFPTCIGSATSSTNKHSCGFNVTKPDGFLKAEIIIYEATVFRTKLQCVFGTLWGTLR